MQQNTGPKNVAIIGKVAEMRKKHSTLYVARASQREWRSLVSAVGSQIKLMPLFKLQTVGRKRLETLYANEDVNGGIVLQKGVQDCFRRFYGIVVRLCRREWLDMVRKLNKATIGAPLDLAEFLFGSERNQWPGIRPVLRELQEGKCFYCQKSVISGQEELDHFIPWSLYPNDLAHNFVLACRRCNNAKSDDLAEVDALDQWIERNKLHAHRIEIEAASIGLPADANASARVAVWAYERETLIESVHSPTRLNKSICLLPPYHPSSGSRIAASAPDSRTPFRIEGTSPFSSRIHFGNFAGQSIKEVMLFLRC